MIIRHVKFTTAADLCEGRSGGGNVEQIAAARVRLAHANFESTRNPSPETDQRAAEALANLERLMNGDMP
jgi:hypothetical protein